METVAGCSIEPALNMSTTSSLHSPANTTYINGHVPNLNHHLHHDPSQLNHKHFTPNNYNAILKSINNNLMANGNNILNNKIGN